MDEVSGTRESQFTACWFEDSPRVAAYAQRHVGLEHAADVVAETFTAAWRRWDEVPKPPLPWLIGTARNVMSNARRSARRASALDVRLRLLSDVAAHVVADLAETAFGRDEAIQALAGLSEDHREALLLVAWDGLSTEAAATVLKIKPDALRTRLSRARRALVLAEAAQQETAPGSNPLPKGASL